MFPTPEQLLKDWPASAALSPKLPSTLPNGKPWPKISVITPSYNQGCYLEQTILSVAHQNYPNVEHLVMDGGSKDNSVSIIKKHESKLAYWVSEKDGGQSNAINAGMNRATGEIVTWLNSDDMLAPGALAAMAMAFHTSDADMVAGICQLHKKNRIFHQHLTSCENGVLSLEDLLDLENCVDAGQFFYQPEVFYKRDLWLKAGGKVDSTLNWVMDYDLWIRFAMAGARLKVIGHPIALFRVHEEQKTNDPKSFRGEALKTQSKYRELCKLPAVVPAKPKPASRKLKVALFNDIGFNYGAGIAHRRLAEALALGGNDVDVLAAGRPLSEVPPGSPVPDMLMQTLDQKKPDVVVFGNLHGLSLDPELITRVSQKIPTVFITHDLWLITGRCVHMRDCEKYLRGCDESCPTQTEYPVVDPPRIRNAWEAKMRALTSPSRLMVMANSDYVADRIKGFLQHLSNGDESKRAALQRVHLGLSTDVFHPIDKATARRKLGLPADKFIILFSAGDLANERKGLRYLFEALELLDLPDLQLVCVGWRDKKKPLPRSGVIEAGYLKDPKRQALYYSAADLFVGPSLEESFGQVYIEAAACGTPSVGFKVTAIPETIIDGITGRLAPEISARSLADAISCLYKNKPLREAMGVWGRILMENDFSTPAYYHRLFAMLRRHLNSTNRFVPPNIALSLNPSKIPPAIYLQDLVLEQASGSGDPIERERAAYLLYRQRLEDYRNAKFPWMLRPAAWNARLRRNRHKSQFEKLKKNR